MKNPGKILDRWIFGFVPVSPEGLALSRILFAAYFLLTGLPRFSWVSLNPPGFFDPPPLSVAALFGQFPPAALMHGIDLLIGLLFICVLVGLRTKLCSILLSAAWIFGKSFQYSFGKIDHDIIAVLTPAIMAFSGWGCRLSIDAKRGRPGGEIRAWPLSVLALLIGFGYFSAGYAKLTWADFNLETAGARNWLVVGWCVLGRDQFLAPYFFRIHNAYFWECLDLIALGFELGFVFSLARLGLFRAFLFFAVMFHILSLLMLNISFLVLVPVYAVFAPWERIVPRLPARLMSFLDGVATLWGLLVLLALFEPLYLLSYRIPVDTGLSHLGVASAQLSLHLDLWLDLFLFSLVMVATLWIAGSPVGDRLPADLVPRGAKRVLFFDGVCNLCNGFIDFMIRRDRHRRFLYGSLQSAAGQKIHQAMSRDAVTGEYDSVILIDVDAMAYRQSDAILLALTLLGGRYRLLSVFWLVPRVIRDVVYRRISRSRYQVFGKRDTCRVPTPEERALFLDTNP